jgi:three-Cys-motif partner protein
VEESGRACWAVVPIGGRGMTDVDPSDGLPVDEVGPWAVEKHARLRRYIDISHGVRRKFAQGRSGSASYIDLFCGSGRALIRGTRTIIDGSPLVGYRAGIESGDPFTEIHLADADQQKLELAAARVAAVGGGVQPHPGRAEDVATTLARELNPYGLHFAFLDPFNLRELPFSILDALSRMKRVDILVHVSAMDLRRNVRRYLETNADALDRFAPGWRDMIDVRETDSNMRRRVFEHWLGLIRMLGMQASEGVEIVTAGQNQMLYWLVFLSRHKRPAEFWEKIRNPSPQGRLAL